MKAIFLDRDGTIIVDPPDERVDTIAKIQLLPQTLEAFKFLAELEFAVIIITNQAGIAEGRITEQQFIIINNKVLDLLKPSGIRILKTYMCPHSSDDNCECRKPKSTMLLQAAKDFDIDLASTYMVGDHQSDIVAGINAGARTILVETGNKPVASDEATYTAANLLAAAQYIAAH